MIVEHELLEQILVEDWALARAVSFLVRHDADAWRVLAGLYADGHIQFRCCQLAELPEWRVSEVLRNKEPLEDVFVHCTERGGSLVA